MIRKVRDIASQLRIMNGDGALSTIFWSGLDCSSLPSGTSNNYHVFPTSYIEYVLWLNGSSITVGKVDEDTITTQSQSPQST